MKMNATVKQGLSTKSRYESKNQKLKRRTVLGQIKWRIYGRVLVSPSMDHCVESHFQFRAKKQKVPFLSEHMINTDYPKILIICKILHLARSEVI